MTYWLCRYCGYERNCGEDGPVCDNCGIDATAPQIGCAERPPEPVVPVTSADFPPVPDTDDVPF